MIDSVLPENLTFIPQIHHPPFCRYIPSWHLYSMAKALWASQKKDEVDGSSVMAQDSLTSSILKTLVVGIRPWTSPFSLG
jgi:hypothetical protein